MHTVKTPVKDEKGTVVGILGIFWDKKWPYKFIYLLLLPLYYDMRIERKSWFSWIC